MKMNHRIRTILNAGKKPSRAEYQKGLAEAIENFLGFNTIPDGADAARVKSMFEKSYTDGPWSPRHQTPGIWVRELGPDAIQAEISRQMVKLP